MKKTKILSIILFSALVSILSMGKYDAKDVCVYNHPNNGCTYTITKNNGTWSDTIAADPGICDRSQDEDILTIFANTTQNPNFFKDFEKAYKETKGCPVIYLGTEVYNCTKGKGASIAVKKNIASFDCYFVYIKRDGYASRYKLYPNKSKSKTELDDAKKIGKLEAISTSDKIFSCQQLIGEEGMEIIDMLFLIIRIATPIFLIVFSMIDFMTVISNGKPENEMKNMTQRFIKRTIAAVLVFLTPTFISFLMNITGITDGVCGMFIIGKLF